MKKQGREFMITEMMNWFIEVRCSHMQRILTRIRMLVTLLIPQNIVTSFHSNYQLPRDDWRRRKHTRHAGVRRNTSQSACMHIVRYGYDESLPFLICPHSGDNWELFLECV